MHRCAAIALACVLLSAGTVSAQTWQQPPASIWSGLYLGAHGGGGWGDFGGNLDGFEDVKGGLGGVHGGYLWQRGNFVFGAEADVSFGQLDDRIEIVQRGNIFGSPFTDTTRLDVQFEKLASLRARIGYTAGPLQFFATGGFAWSWVELAFFDSFTLGGSTIVSDDVSAKDVLTGWTAGGGIEYKFTQNFSGRVDVQHYRFDDSFDFAGSQIDDVEVDLTVVRGGLTFHFN